MSKPPSILVVDDDVDILEILALLLEVQGFRVVTARNGDEAVKRLAQEGSISLILLDLMMPGIDGEQFLLWLRRNVHPRIPVVVLSGHGHAQDRAAELGANGCLAKPVDLEELVRTIRRLVRQGNG